MTHDLTFTESRVWDLALVGCAAAAIILLLVWPGVEVALGGDQYLYLARSFAHGTLNVDNLPPGYGDYATWHGHKYLPFGPLPAVILIPFLPLLNAGLPMVIVGYALTVVNAFLFLRVLRLAGVDGERRYWSTLLYFGGTPYLSVVLVGISTYFAHVTVTTFLFLALMLVLERRHFFFVGVCIGLAACARLSALGSLAFFIWWIHSAHPGRKEFRRADALSIVGGVGLPLLVFAWYNAARFGSPFETGFGLAHLYTDTLYEARRVGLFSVAHIPKNLFMMLLQGPVPFGGDNAPTLRFPFVAASPWGMGIFFTSPAMVYMFRAPWRAPVVQACWLAVIATAIPIVTYYGIGYVQFGYRYALDFMPFLVLLTALGFHERISSLTRSLVVASVFINIWGAIYLAVWLSH
jgi:hypothetical protein